MHNGWLIFGLQKYHHALPYVLFTDFLESERGALTGCGSRDGNTLALNASYCCCGELAKRVRTNQDSVAGMYDAGFDDAANNSANKGNGESVVDVEFERSFNVIMAVMREDVEEGPHKIERLACDV